LQRADARIEPETTLDSLKAPKLRWKFFCGSHRRRRGRIKCSRTLR
jgi:hypothetical protein